MNTEVLKKVQSNFMNKKVPVIEPGYTVEFDTIIREGNKQRKQKFRGLVIAVSGNGTDKMITVRKISYGYGVEKKLPLYSPNISGIKVLKKEDVRRSKLYFMRDRVGKSAMRIKKGKAQFVGEDDISYMDEYRPEVEDIPMEADATTEAQVTETAENNSEEPKSE